MSILGDCCIFKSTYGLAGLFRGRFKRAPLGLLTNRGQTPLLLSLVCTSPYLLGSKLVNILSYFPKFGQSQLVASGQISQMKVNSATFIQTVLSNPMVIENLLVIKPFVFR